VLLAGFWLTERRAARNTASPTGTLMRNTERQPSQLVSAPPASTPSASPALASPPQTASARARLSPV